jgi:predicted PurR-regulated permease PerM
MNFSAPSEKQARILWFAATAVATAIVLTLIGVILWGAAWTINKLSSILLPLAIAGILAYLIDPVVSWTEKKLKIPRARAVLMVMFAAVMAILMLLTTFIPTLLQEIGILVRNVSDATYVEEAKKKLGDWLEIPDGASESATASSADPSTNAVVSAASEGADKNAVLNAVTEGTTNNVMVDLPTHSASSEKGDDGWKQALVDKAEAWLTANLPTIWEWIMTQASKLASWGGLVIGMAMVPVYLFYFLLEKRGIRSNWTDYLPLRESKMKEELVFVLKEINERLIVFFRSQVLVAMCVGGLLIIGYKLIGLEYAFLLGVLAGILGIVPYLGVMLSIVPALTLCIIQFGDWPHAFALILLFVAVQAAEGLYISPKIIGDRVGLHPLTIILAVMVGTTLLGGIIGGILAIPLTAALRTLMFRYVWNRKRFAETAPPGTPESLEAIPD